MAILLLVLKFQAVNAQKEGVELIDSLYAELPTLIDDTNKVKVLAMLSNQLTTYDLKKGVEVGKQALKLAEELEYVYGIALSKLSISMNYWRQSELSLVMENVMDAMSTFQEVKDNDRLCATYCLLSAIHRLYDSIKGKEYYYKAKSLLISHKDDQKKRRNLSWIRALSLTFEPDSTYLFTKQYLQLVRSQKSNSGLALYFFLIAVNYKNKKDIDSSLFYCKRADTLVLKLQLKSVQSGVYSVMASLYLEKGKDHTSGLFYQHLAEEYYKRSIMVAEEYGSLRRVYMEYWNLYLLQKDLNKTDQALLSHEKFSENYHEWILKNNADRLAYFAYKDEIEQNEMALEFLQIQNKRQLTIIIVGIIGVGILIILTILLILIWRNNLQMKKREIDHQLVTLEQKALQSMMNPHFIFNSLGSIHNYILQKNASKAGLYLSQFARLIRQNLNAIKAAMINLDEEADRLKNYLDLEKMRLTNKFDYSITIDESIEASETFIPSMMIQPLVENALWHGITRLKEKGMVSVYFQKEDEHALKIIVEDNGVGLKKSALYSSNIEDHLGLTLDLNRKRLELLGKKFNVVTWIEFSEAFPNRENPGTRVEIVVPYSYTDSMA